MKYNNYWNGFWVKPCPGKTVKNIPPQKYTPGIVWYMIVIQNIPPLQMTGVWKCNFWWCINSEIYFSLPKKCSHIFNCHIGYFSFISYCFSFLCYEYCFVLHMWCTFLVFRSKSWQKIVIYHTETFLKGKLKCLEIWFKCINYLPHW